MTEFNIEAPMHRWVRKDWGGWYIHDLTLIRLGDAHWHVIYRPAWWQVLMSWFGAGPTRKEMRMHVVSKIANLIHAPVLITDVQPPDHFELSGQ